MGFPATIPPTVTHLAAQVQIVQKADMVVAEPAPLASSSPSHGSNLVVHTSQYAGTTSRTQDDKNLDSISVFEWFTQAQRDDVRSRTAALDVSDRIMAAHEALVGTGRKLRFPSGKYLWATAQTTRHVPAWEGESPEAYDGGKPSTGVQFKCTVTGVSNYSLTINCSNFETSPYLRNLRWTGGGTASNAIYMHGIGSTGTIENVCIDNFTGWGLNSGYLQDIKFWNLWIYKCGSVKGSYGLRLGPLSNLLHFYGGRVEDCKGMVRADSVTGIFFQDMHFEEPVHSNYTAPPIYITSSLAVKFAGGMMGANSVENLMSLNSQSADAVAPLVSTEGCTDLSFSNVSFIYGGLPPGGAKYLSIRSTSATWYSMVSGCSFQNQDCRVPGIVCEHNTFKNNTINVWDNQTTTNFKILQLTFSICSGNRVLCENSSSATKSSGYVFEATAPSILNSYGDNQVVVNKLYKYANKNWYTNNQGPTQFAGLASAATYDMEFYPQNYIIQPGNASITGFLNTMRGQIITVMGVPAYTPLLRNGTSLVLKGGANVTIPINGIIKLQNLNGDGVMYEISRNF